MKTVKDKESDAKKYREKTIIEIIVHKYCI